MHKRGAPFERTRAWASVSARVRQYTHIRTRAPTRAHTETCTPTRTHTCKHKCTQTSTHSHAHAHTTPTHTFDHGDPQSDTQACLRETELTHKRTSARNAQLLECRAPTPAPYRMHTYIYTHTRRVNHKDAREGTHTRLSENGPTHKQTSAQPSAQHAQADKRTDS